MALILQSFRETEVTSWIDDCMTSVRAWAERHGYAYRFVGDELLDLVPDWYMAKVGTRLPIATDLARLIWMRDTLTAGEADVVVWADADFFVFAPEYLTVPEEGESCFFGRELWLQRDDAGRVRAHRNVHNAYCGFRTGSPVLPFLIDTVERLVGRVDTEHLAPQFVGPKLLTSLHNIVGVDIEERAGAISPLMMDALLEDDAEIMAAFKSRQQAPLAAANLCASLHAEDEARLTALLARLREFRSGLT